MGKRFAIMVLAGIYLLLASPSLSTSPEPRTEFCAHWNNRCLETCLPNIPAVVCHATCEDRHQNCKVTGCYHFNKPGPQCQLPQSLQLSDPPQPEPKTEFCTRWHNVCLQTCPKDVSTETCRATCENRLRDCPGIGCYHFDKPGPRCQSPSSGQLR